MFFFLLFFFFCLLIFLFGLFLMSKKREEWLEIIDGLTKRRESLKLVSVFFFVSSSFWICQFLRILTLSPSKKNVCYFIFLFPVFIFKNNLQR